MSWELVSALAGSLAFFAPLSDNFAGKSNAPLRGYDTGQPRYLMSLGTSDRLQIIDGKMTLPSTTASNRRAGYSHANLGKKVSSIGGSFVLQPGTVDGGSAAFLIWNWLPQNELAPESAFHMVITRIGWSLGTYRWTNYNPPFPNKLPDAVLIPYASGNFSPPLPNNGTTVLSFSADIDTAAGTAVLHLPDGTTQTVGPTPIISTTPGIGNYPGWEVYQNTNTEDKAAFITIFAK